MKKKVLILEDHESTRTMISDIVRNCSSEQLTIQVFETDNVAKAYEYAMNQEIDLFLLDIVLNPKQANDTSGVNFALNIRKIQRYEFTNILFITTVQGLEAHLLRSVHCYDYIEKPICKSELEKMVCHLLYHKEEEREDTILLKQNGVYFPVRVDDIYYVESKHRALYVYQRDEVTKVWNLSLNSFLDEVGSSLFLICKRGVAVNKRYIKAIDLQNRYIALRGRNDEIEIGPIYKDSILEELKHA